MAPKEGGSEGSTKRKEVGSLGGLGSKLKGSWLAKNWQTTLVLAMILLLAFFVRAYFAYPVSVDNGYLVSGGSDSYYHARVIDHVVATGEHLVYDDMLNYPFGVRNMRPPLYDWSVAVSGMSLSALGVSLDDAVGMSLVTSTAFWGALTVIPVYLIANTAFGRKVGLIAGFLFALMPGNIERSIFSNADHDAMVLFFVVFAFYFLLRSLQTIKGTKWVESWRKPSAIKGGLRSYFQGNQLSLIYAALAGICVAAVAMIWTGYTYLLIIVLVYLILQLLIDRFRNTDSMGVLLTFIVMWGVAFLVMMPVYYSMDYWSTWFDVPVYLYLVGIVFALMFVVSRDYPWVIVLPVIIGIVAVAMVVLYLVAPWLLDAVLSGQGYLVKSKLYSTISEAQAPDFSNLVLSIGAVTFWLALFGVGYAAIRIPKDISPFLVFVVVWGAVSIYMASSAARFLFNASPAFAVLAAEVLALIIDRMHFTEYFKSLSMSARQPKAFLRKLVNVRVLLVAVLIVVLLLMPNVWTALDASIPAETKRDYDKQIYNVMPSFLQPADYDRINGSYWYLGGFYYSLPLPETYWPSAWSWFSNNASDVNRSEEDRAAFLSWWDYGFEAIQQGEHPTVADNFQDAYQFAGTFICSQSETQAVALFIARLAERMVQEETQGKADYTDFWTSMSSYGVDVVKLKDVLAHPGDYKDYILSHSEIFGAYDSDLSDENAKWAMSSHVLEEVGMEALVEIYHEQRVVSSYDIGYFAVDGRLFPFTATSSNIFYAPAKLSDRRIASDSNTPIDFYRIIATDQYGNDYDIDVDDIPSDVYIVDYKIEYSELFYNSMLYRAMMGFSPGDVGESEQGIPGISGSLAGMDSMQAWNLTHFRVVYRTAYYNPWPENETAFHADEWVAIDYLEALKLQELQDQDLFNGTIDTSTVSLYPNAYGGGVVFIQYYDGVEIKGNAVTDTGEPMPGIWVTVLDEYGIPHQTVKTDEDGYYEVIAPFGQVQLVYSYGALDQRTQIATRLTSVTYNFTYEQAMHLPALSSAQTGGVNANTEPDWLVDGNITIGGGNIKGRVYVDINSNNKYDAGTDQLLEGATVHLEDPVAGFSRTYLATDSNYSFVGLPPMSANLWVEYQGHTVGSKTISVTSKQNSTIDVVIKPATIESSLVTTWGTPAAGVGVDLIDEANGQVTTITTNSTGKIKFSGLFKGNYTIRTNSSLYSLGAQRYVLSEGEKVQDTITLYEAMVVSGQVQSYSSVPAAYARIGFNHPLYEAWTTADANGYYSIALPRLNYSVYAIASIGGTERVVLLRIAAHDSLTQNLNLVTGYVLEGYVLDGNSTVSGCSMVLTNNDGSVLEAVTNAKGQYRIVLPNGTYQVYAAKGTKAVWSSVATKKVNITLGNASVVSGKVWYDKSYDGEIQSNEGKGNITLTVTNSQGRKITIVSSNSGSYSIALPNGGGYTISLAQTNHDPYSFSYANLTSNQTLNIQMVPSLRQLSGTTELNGTALGNITVYFTAISGNGVDASMTSGTDGAYQLLLRPGNYRVSVDQNVSQGDPSSRYQLLEDLTQTIAIGQDPTVLDLEVVERYRVNGTIDPASSGFAEIRFIAPGLDSVTVQSNTSSYETYLRPGHYSVYALWNVGTVKEVFFNVHDVTGASTWNISGTAAAMADLDLRYLSAPLLMEIPFNLTDPVTGAVLPVDANIVGTATVYLPFGNYTLQVDHQMLTKVTGLEQKRYLRFTATQTTYLNLSSQNIDVPLTLSYDNATVTGLPVGADLQFYALSETAMDIFLGSTAGTADLAPGNYSVYARSGTQAYLGTVEVLPYVSNDLGLVLSPAYRVSGTTYLDEVGKQANLTFKQGAAYYQLSSGANGTYEIYLPAGSYTAWASTTKPEQGTQVEYNDTQDLTVSGALTRNFDMTRTVQYDVDVEWDGEEQLVENGTPVEYTITIKNTGNMVDSYNLTASGYGWNVTFARTTIANLTYGSSGSINVKVTLIPSALVNVVHFPVVVTATSLTDGTVKDSVSLNADIVPRYQVNLSYSEAADQNGTDYRYYVTVTNSGNIQDLFHLQVANSTALAEKGWNATMRLGNTGNFSSTLTLNMSAGSVRTILVNLHPTVAHPEANVTLQLRANSTTNATSEYLLEMVPPYAVFEVTEDGSAVSGEDITTQLPEVPLQTWVLLGAVAALLALLLYLSLKKGVFSRKK